MRKGKSTYYFGIFFITLFLAATSSFAGDKDTKNDDSSSAWKDSNAQFGFTANTGNTETTAIDSSLTVNYARTFWKNAFQATFQFQNTQSQISKQQFFAQDQSNFQFKAARQQFIFINTNLTVNKLSPYGYQLVFASGYGFNLINRDNFKWNLQAGPGFRANEILVNRHVDLNYATTAQSIITWNITPRVEFIETMSAVFGSPSDYYKSVTALNNKITDHFATNLSFTADYYDTIPPDSTFTQKTNTITMIALVYNFG